MSFAPTKFATATQPRKQQQSPPKFSAEVVAKFDSNLRAFDPTKRRNSPKGIVQRKLSPPPAINQQQGNIITSPQNGFQKKSTPVSRNNNNKNNHASSFLLQTPSPAQKKRVSPSSSYANDQSRPKNVFGASSINLDKFSASQKMQRNDQQNPFVGKGSSHHTKQQQERESEVDEREFPKKKLSSQWICVHAKLVEIEHVEELLRRKYEELEYRHFAAIVHFRNSLEV